MLWRAAVWLEVLLVPGTPPSTHNRIVLVSSRPLYDYVLVVPGSADIIRPLVHNHKEGEKTLVSEIDSRETQQEKLLTVYICNPDCYIWESFCICAVDSIYVTLIVIDCYCSIYGILFASVQL
jgi:hypothetical protein